MATRGGRSFAADPLDGVVRSLYSAGIALVGVGFVAVVLGWASVLEATGSVARSTTVATNALGGPVLGTGTASGVVHLGAFAVVGGVWLLGVGLVVDGLLDA